jgi:hypothetical protein
LAIFPVLIDFNQIYLLDLQQSGNIYDHLNQINMSKLMNNNKKAASSTLSPCSSSNTMSPISSPHNEFINILIDNPATSLTSLDKQLTKFNQDQKREEDRTQSFLAKVNARITNNMINNSSNNNNSKNGSNTFNFESNVTNTTKKMPPNNKLIADNLFTNTINNQTSNRTSK